MAAVLCGVRMARTGGRTGGGKTVSVRIYAEEADMLYWIGEVTKESSAAIMRPICRPSLSAKYEMHRPQIERLKALRAAEQDVIDEVAGKPAQPPAPPPDPDTGRTPPKRRRSGGS